MHPIVDEAAFAIVWRLGTPHQLEERGKTHLGFGVLFTTGGERGEDLCHGTQTTCPNGLHQSGLVHGNARHVVVSGRVVLDDPAGGVGDQLGDQRFA